MPSSAPTAPAGWLTGTAIDEFTGVYMALNTPTRTRAAIGPAEADLMDLTVVAGVLGVVADVNAATDPRVVAAAMADARRRGAQAAMDRARSEGREISWAEADREAGVTWASLTN